MFDLRSTAALENLEKTGEIGCGVELWILHRVADAGLRREVNH